MNQFKIISAMDSHNFERKRASGPTKRDPLMLGREARRKTTLPLWFRGFVAADRGDRPRLALGLVGARTAERLRRNARQISGAHSRPLDRRLGLAERHFVARCNYAIQSNALVRNEFETRRREVLE
ncbi:hypothetical protein CN934_29325 [Ensifer sp. MMN_5]|nr:hypothetical protein CN934_29325 [Ensifer sp. MMN_5]